MTWDNTRRPAPRFTPRLIVGCAIMAVGVLFTLDNLGVLEAGSIFRYWPVVLIVIGLAKLAEPTPGQSVFAAWTFLIGGGLLLGANLNVISMKRLFPLFIVGAGGAMVYQALRGPRPVLRRSDVSTAGQEDYVKSVAFMSGVKRAVSSLDFRGGEAMAFMGGVELDLRNAQVVDEAVFDAFAFWGGVDITVPLDWEVVNRGFALMGGFEDKTTRTASPRGRLVVTGVAIMGGVEVKN